MNDEVKEFIVKQSTEKAQAAAVLSEDLRINGIDIQKGCDKIGIHVYDGIEKLADILGAKLEETTEDEGGSYLHAIRYFDFNGSRFYEEHLISKKEPTDEV